MNTAIAQTQAGAQASGSASNQTSVSADKSGAQASSQSATRTGAAATTSHNGQERSNASANGSAINTASAALGPGSANLAGGSTVNAVLNKSVDVKKNRPGDEVTAKVTQNVKSSAGGSSQVVIPKGSRLVGHVTECKPREKGHKSSAEGNASASGQADSALGIVFDKAILKNGKEVPMHAVIQAVGAAQQSLTAAGPGSDVMESTSGMASGSAVAGGGRSGGGLLGGGGSTVGSTLGSTTGAVGNTTAGLGNTTGGALNATTNAAGSLGSNVGGATTATGQLMSSANGVIGLRGLNLSSVAANPTQGSLITSSTRDVHLDSGTQMVLRIVGSVQ
ncbi:MAG: hypothetical protein LAN37_15740 [Acidobacteriia bacterium]|nr:hypothetical protein [Terriglobia bacterium]